MLHFCVPNDFPYLYSSRNHTFIKKPHIHQNVQPFFFDVVWVNISPGAQAICVQGAIAFAWSVSSCWFLFCILVRRCVVARERLQSALEVLGESESAVAKRLRCSKLAAQGRPLTAQFEECQASSVPRTGCPVWRKNGVAEQEALDAGLARLARIRQEMTGATESATPVTIPNGAGTLLW